LLLLLLLFVKTIKSTTPPPDDTDCDYNFAKTFCLLTPDGELIDQWGYGHNYTPQEIATDADGFLYVNLDNSPSTMLKVNISSRQIVGLWNMTFLSNGIAVDSVNRWIYVGMFGSLSVAKLSTVDGTIIQTLDIHERAMSITVDVNSDIYVSTQGNNIIRMNNTGHIFSVFNTSTPPMVYPFGMGVTLKKDHLVVSDYGNHRLIEFDRRGQIVHVLDVQKLYPQLMAIQRKTGNIFITAQLTNSVYVFSPFEDDEKAIYN